MDKGLILSHQQCDSWDQRTPMMRDCRVMWGGHAGHPSPGSTCVLGVVWGRVFWHPHLAGCELSSDS